MKVTLGINNNSNNGGCGGDHDGGKDGYGGSGDDVDSGDHDDYDENNNNNNSNNEGYVIKVQSSLYELRAERNTGTPIMIVGLRNETPHLLHMLQE
jgi:hypothetical protein